MHSLTSQNILPFADLTNEYKLADAEETMKFVEQTVAPVKMERDAIVPTVYVEEGSPESLPSPTERSMYLKQEPSKPEPVFQENRQLEFLIDAVMSCQDAVYPNLKKHYAESRDQEHIKIFVSKAIYQNVSIVQSIFENDPKCIGFMLIVRTRCIAMEPFTY